ncbi:MAG: pitrilysin family protein [Nitrospirota bacterium]
MSVGRAARGRRTPWWLWVLAVSVVPIAPVCAAAAGPAQVTVQRWVMSNGLTVLFVERHTIPAVQARLVVKTGAAADPAGRTGLAALTAGLLTKGTTSRSAVEIAEAVDFIGGTLTADAEDDSSSISLTTLKKDLRVALSLMTDVVLNPSFPPTEVDRLRRETLSAIQAEKDDPGAVAEKAFAPLVFGPHPYGRPVEGLETTVPTLTREEAVAFHRTYYRPNNAVLVLVGDLTLREARRVAKNAFGAWEPKPVPTVAVPALPPVGERRVSLIEKDLTQATVLLGHLGIARTDPDFYAVTVMNYILGGGSFSSRLMSRIRDNEGLVYGISSGYDAKQYPGAFSVGLQTKTESAPAAIRAVLEEITKLRAEGATAAELEAAKNYLAGSFPLRYETNARMAILLGYVELYGLGLTYFEDYPNKIRAVTLDDVRRVASARLDPLRYVLVVVGKTGDIAGGLDQSVPAKNAP